MSPLVVLDLDGTLVDSVPDLAAALNRLMSARQIAPFSHPDVAAMVGDGAAALAAAADGVFDLIVMDVMMPGMDGLAATRAIRALPGAAATVPIIGLSASTTAEDEAACHAAGMTAFAPKPISAPQLADIVQRVARPAPPASPAPSVCTTPSRRSTSSMTSSPSTAIASP